MLVDNNTPQAAVEGDHTRREAARVSERVVAGVGERHVAHAERMVLAQDGDGVPELVATACNALRSSREKQKKARYPSTPSKLCVVVF